MPVSDEQRRVKERERKARYRARKRAEGAAPVKSNVTPLRAAKHKAGDAVDTASSPTVDAVLKALDGMQSAADRPDLAAAAIAMAALIDNPAATPMAKPPATKQLQEIMSTLREAKESKGGKLADLRRLRSS